jgi:hypothetical protein
LHQFASSCWSLLVEVIADDWRSGASDDPIRSHKLSLQSTLARDGDGNDDRMPWWMLPTMGGVIVEAGSRRRSLPKIGLARAGLGWLGLAWVDFGGHTPGRVRLGWTCQSSYGKDRQEGATGSGEEGSHAKGLVCTFPRSGVASKRIRAHVPHDGSTSISGPGLIKVVCTLPHIFFPKRAVRHKSPRMARTRQSPNIQVSLPACSSLAESSCSTQCRDLSFPQPIASGRSGKSSFPAFLSNHHHDLLHSMGVTGGSMQPWSQPDVGQRLGWPSRCSTVGRVLRLACDVLG